MSRFDVMEHPGEPDGEAIERYLRTPWAEVHPGTWTAICTIAADWYDEAQRLADRVDELKERFKAERQRAIDAETALIRERAK